MSEQQEFILQGPEPYEPFPEDTLGQMIYRSLTNKTTENNEAFVSFISLFTFHVLKT